MRVSKAMLTKISWVLILTLMLTGEASEKMNHRSHFLSLPLGIMAIIATVAWALWALYISRNTRADALITRSFPFLLPTALLLAGMNISIWYWIGILLSAFLIWTLFVGNKSFLTWAKSLEPEKE
ncbi:hypothetical protein MHT86_07955 [Corynebacterium mastitidis]|uniref:Uncharacterized protein n=1 Tax=Corynebacterium mastitidis TaxID=161890 RepID=A0A2N0XA30_9CORY|nr:hypothetical protein [Corynebacterium mastitidis]MCH6197426.1 hypothetical protein [Corynebacterium mastitidis]PKF69566.1 hypothetical protein CXB45_01555 [Corynebacterium mastitidis]